MDGSSAPRHSLRQFLYRNRYGLCLGVLLLQKLLRYVPFRMANDTDPWNYYVYYADYKTLGFVPRGLLGSWIRLFTDYVTEGLVFVLATAATAALLLTACMLFQRTACGLSEGRTAFVFLSFLFVLLPDGVFYFFSPGQYGIVDVYLLLLTAAMASLVGRRVGRWFVPLLCLVCMALYEAYCLAYFPALAIMMLYRIVCTRDKRDVLVFLLSCMMIAASFIYFFFVFRACSAQILRITDPAALEEALAARTSLDVSEIAREFLFSPASTATDGSLHEEHFLLSRHYLFLSCFPAALAVFGGVSVVWLRAFRTERESVRKAVFALCLLAPLCQLPFLAFSQQMKYVSYFVLSQWMLLCYFARRDPVVRRSLQKADEQLKRQPVVLYLLCAVTVYLRNLFPVI